MQNAACTQDTHIQYLHDESLPIPEHLQLLASQYKQKTQHPSHPLHKHTTSIPSPTQIHNILQLSKAKNTIFNNGRYTTNIPTDPHTVTTTYIKTNLRHIHTSIVSRHLTTRGNNKILHTPGNYGMGLFQQVDFYTGVNIRILLIVTIVVNWTI